MKNMLFVIILVFSVLLSPLSVQARTNHATMPDFVELTESARESDMSVENLFEKIKEMHKDFTSVNVTTEMRMKLKVDGEENKYELVHTSLSKYDNENVSAIHSITENLGKDKSYTENVITTDDPSINYWKEELASDFYWEDIEDESVNEYIANRKAMLMPHYFSLLHSIMEVKNDLSLQETDDEYILTLNNQDPNLSEIFKEVFAILEDMPEVGQKVQFLTLVIDKENYFIKAMDLNIAHPVDENNLMILTIQNSFSQWNQVSDENINNQVLK